MPKEDEQVDVLYDRIYRDLIDVIVKDPRTIDQAIRLSWVAHNLERVADRVSNLCERVVFAVEGRMEELAALTWMSEVGRGHGRPKGRP